MPMSYDRDAKLAEIVALAKRLIRNAAVTVGAELNHAGIRASYSLLAERLEQAGLNVVLFQQGSRFPAIYCDAGPRGAPPRGDLLFAGHFDVVAPQHRSQLEPAVDGDWLRGRGAADMLTVVATLATFFCDLAQKLGGDRPEAPRLGMILVGNEEDGETEPWGTPFVLQELEARHGYRPTCLVAGERTGEGAVVAGKVETRNRGLVRVELESTGEVGHTGMTKRTAISALLTLYRELEDALATSEPGPWRTTSGLSYVFGGVEGNFNISARRAVAGFEARPAFAADTRTIRQVIGTRAPELGIEARYRSCEDSVEVDQADARVQRIVAAASAISGVPPADLLGTGKLAGTQARFAPPGCAPVVWGQAGVGPHAAHEAHYLPSVLPWYEMLWALA